MFDVFVYKTVTISKPILFLCSSMLMTLTSSLLPRSTELPRKKKTILLFLNYAGYYLSSWCYGRDR